MQNDDLLWMGVEKRSHLTEILGQASAVEAMLTVERAAIRADLHVEIPDNTERLW